MYPKVFVGLSQPGHCPGRITWLHLLKIAGDVVQPLSHRIDDRTGLRRESIRASMFLAIALPQRGTSPGKYWKGHKVQPIPQGRKAVRCVNIAPHSRPMPGEVEVLLTHSLNSCLTIAAALPGAYTSRGHLLSVDWVELAPHLPGLSSLHSLLVFTPVGSHYIVLMGREGKPKPRLPLNQTCTSNDSTHLPPSAFRVLAIVRYGRHQDYSHSSSYLWFDIRHIYGTL